MSDDDIERWIKGLRGGTTDAGDADARAGKRLGNLLHDVDHADPLPPMDRQAWHRLRFRLRREGLLQAPTKTRNLALAAAVSVLGLTALLVANHEEKAPLEQAAVWRGSEDTQRIFVGNPNAAAERLVKLLEMKNIMTRRTPEQGGVRVQAQIDETVREQLESLLRLEDIRIPAHGRLDLLFLPKQ